MLETTGGITFLPTNDLEATHAFFTEVLELTLALDQSECRIYRVAPGCFWGFCQTDVHADPRKTILTLVAPDVDGWYERVTRAGVPTEGGPKVNEAYMIYHFFTKDPNGYRIEIQRFLDPRWK